MRMRKTGAPVHAGHAGVRLADGTLVLLEPSWSQAALWPAEERRRLSGKAVAVIGKLHAQAPRPAGEQVAQVIGPCISPVEEVKAR